jgi:O-antigen ligase
MNVVRLKNPDSPETTMARESVPVDTPVLLVKDRSEEQEIKPLVRWAFYGFLATIPFETVELGIPVELTMITIGLLFVSVLSQPALVFRTPPVAFAFFGAYLFVCFAAFALNTPPELYREGLWQIMVITQLVVMSWVAFNIFKSENVARRALFVFALSCGLLAILQQAGISQSNDGVGGIDRVTALGFHPNNIARILSLALLAMAGLVYGVKRSAFRTRAWVWAFIALLSLTIVQTGSRGGLLALGAGLSMFAIKQGDISTKFRNLAFVGLGFVFLVALVFQSEMSLSRFESAFEEGDLARRELIYPTAWEMIKEKPVIGWGAKAGEYELGARLAHPEEEKKNAHNLILYALMSVGVIGFVPLILGIWFTVRAAWSARAGPRGVLPLALLAALLVANMSSIWINNKMHWIVVAYALSSIYTGTGAIRVYLRAGNEPVDGRYEFVSA